MRPAVAALRALAVVAVFAAVVAQWLRSQDSGTYQFANFFGYFTIQSNLIAAVAFAVGAVTVLRRADPPGWSVLLRGAATAYMVTTGVVYNTVLVEASLGGSFTVPWSNDVLHRWIPVFALLDWLVVADRSRIPWRRAWVFLVYPLVWLGVVLLRGKAFVPYPFLDVQRLGGGVVAVWCLGIAVFIAGMSALVVATSGRGLVRPADRSGLGDAAGPSAAPQRSGS
jgi:hypothetical protein